MTGERAEDKNIVVCCAEERDVVGTNGVEKLFEVTLGGQASGGRKSG